MYKWKHIEPLRKDVVVLKDQRSLLTRCWEVDFFYTFFAPDCRLSGTKKVPPRLVFEPVPGEKTARSRELHLMEKRYDKYKLW